MTFLYFAPTGEMVGLMTAVAFFLILVGAAYVAFKALKKTAKMAVRMMIVMVILAVAVVGSLSLWYFSGEGTQKQKPPAERRR